MRWLWVQFQFEGMNCFYFLGIQGERGVVFPHSLCYVSEIEREIENKMSLGLGFLFVFCCMWDIIYKFIIMHVYMLI